MDVLSFFLDLEVFNSDNSIMFACITEIIFKGTVHFFG